MICHALSSTFFLILTVTSCELSSGTRTEEILEQIIPKIISGEVGGVRVDSPEPQLHRVGLPNGRVVRIRNDHGPEAGQDKNKPSGITTTPNSNERDIQNGESSGRIKIPLSSHVNISSRPEMPPPDSIESKMHEHPAIDDLRRINRLMNASLSHFLSLPNISGKQEMPSSGRSGNKLHVYSNTNDLLRNNRFMNASLVRFLSKRIQHLTRLGESMEHLVSQAFGKVLSSRPRAKTTDDSLQKTGERSGHQTWKHQHGGSSPGKHFVHGHEQLHSDTGPNERDHHPATSDERDHHGSTGWNHYKSSGRDHYAASPKGRNHHAASPNGRDHPDTSPDGQYSPEAETVAHGYHNFDSRGNHHGVRPKIGKYAHRHKLALNVEDFRKAVFFGFALGVLCVLILSMVVFIVKRVLPKRFTSALRRLPYGKEKPLSWPRTDYSPITVLLPPIRRSASGSRRPTIVPCDDHTT